MARIGDPRIPMVDGHEACHGSTRAEGVTFRIKENVRERREDISVAW